MTAIGTLPVLFGTGIHASRPAASAVGKGGLYACSTHALIYQTDGSSWTTWATLTGTGLADPMTTRGDIIVRDAANASARLGRGAAGKILTSDGTDVAYGQGPLTTTGDLMIGATGGTPTRLAAGATSGHVLTSNGSGAAPSYQAPAAGGATISTAKSVGNAQWGAASPAASSITLPSTPTNGNTMLGVVIHESTTTTTTSIAQTNVAWTLVKRYAGSARTIEIWKGVISASPGTGITLTNSATGYNSLFAAEFSGITGTLVDFVQGSGSGTTEVVMPCLTPTGGQMVLCALGINSGSNLSRVATGPVNGFRWDWTGSGNSFKGDVTWASAHPVAPAYFDGAISSGYAYLAISLT